MYILCGWLVRENGQNHVSMHTELLTCKQSGHALSSNPIIHIRNTIHRHPMSKYGRTDGRFINYILLQRPSD